MKPLRLISCSCLIVAMPLMAQDMESTKFPENTTIRDYAKRDRLLLGSLYQISPAQLHENAGLRTRAGVTWQNIAIERGNIDSDLQSPTLTANIAYGWDRLTLALDASYLDASNDSEDAIDEDFQSTKLIPQIAYTLTPNVSFGAGVELSTLNVTENGQNEVEFDYSITRPFLGMAYHTKTFEIGFNYSAEVQTDDTLGADERREGTLSLASLNADRKRSIYLPEMATIYGRGNLTPNFSMLSTLSMTRYDGNVEGAVQLFENYETADRLAAKLVGTYWTDKRSHISLAAEYQGATTTEIGTDEALLGYRLVNLYGASLEGALSLNRKAYIGLLASYMRGERSDTSDAGLRYSGSEDLSRFSGFVTVKL